MKEQITEMSRTIQRILTHGIDIGKLNKEESLNYLLSLSQYINSKNLNKSVYEDGKILIETINFDPIVMLRINKGTLEFLPLSDDNFFNSFLDILEFVSLKNQQKTMSEDFEEFVKNLEDEEEDDSEFDWL